MNGANGLTPPLQLDPRLALAALAAFLVATYLPNLGSPSGQTRPEEQFNMAVSAEMHRAGEWATPTLDGSPWFYKPPLLYWLQQISYSSFGRGVFGARLPAALAAILAALLTGLLGRMLGARAVLSALLCGGSLGMVMNGRLAITDAPLVLGLCGAFACLWTAHARGDGRWLGPTGALVGLAMLAKGPVAAVIFFVGGAAFVLLRPRPKPDPLLRPLSLLLGVACAVAVALPWYVLMYERHGQVFYDFFFVKMNVDRFRSPWRIGSLGITWGGLLGALVPWTPLAVAAVIDALSRAHRKDPRRLLVLCWAAATMLVFSIPAEKYPHHILPAVPPLAILVALAFDGSPRSRAMRIGLWGSAAICAIAAVAALVGARALPTSPSLALFAVMALAVAAYVTGRLLDAAALGVLGLSCAFAWLLPAAGYSPWPDGPVPERPLNVYRQAPGLITLASGRVARYLPDSAQVDDALSRGELVWMTESDRTAFSHVVVATQPRLRSNIPVDLIERALREGRMDGMLDRVYVVGRELEAGTGATSPSPQTK